MDAKAHGYPGELLIPAAAAWTPGRIVQLAGGLAAVFMGAATAVSGASVHVRTSGVFECAVATATTFSAGDPVEWDDTNKLCVAAGSGDFYLGTAHVAKVAGPTTMLVGLNSRGVTAAIASLTDNSGGTAGDTLADITEANNAGSSDRVPTEDGVASLAAKVNGILGALRKAGIIDET